MRTLAVEPPPVLDKEERRVKFINRNGNHINAFMKSFPFPFLSIYESSLFHFRLKISVNSV